MYQVVVTHLIEREEEVDYLSFAIWVLNHGGILGGVQRDDLVKCYGPLLTRMRMMFGCLNDHQNAD